MAVLETPWFMKTKTSDLGRINKVFDERFLASVAQIDTKKRKSLLKLEEEIKNIKSEFKHIRSEVDFYTDLDEHGHTLNEEEAKNKSTPPRKQKGAHFGGSSSVPLGLEMERERYRKIIGRNRRREMTMIELREMCHTCVNKESNDGTSRYIQQARKVLFPKPPRVKKDKKKEKEHMQNNNRFSKYTNKSFSKDIDANNELPRVTRTDADLHDIPVPDRVPLRAKSATSSGRDRDSAKPTLSRVKSLHVVNSSELQTSMGIMTSVSV